MKFSLDTFTRNIEELSKLKLQLPFKPRILEIGSREGQSTLWMIQNFDPSYVLCVDIWKNQKWEDNFLYNLKEAKPNCNVQRIKADSTETLIELLNRGEPDFDLIYIDADHTATAVLTQACLAFRMLRTKGVIVFDDYGWKGGAQNGYKLPPYEGIDCFVCAFREEIEVLHRGWQYHVKKK